jgi:hypothetical protein
VAIAEKKEADLFPLQFCVLQSNIIDIIIGIIDMGYHHCILDKSIGAQTLPSTFTSMSIS